MSEEQTTSHNEGFTQEEIIQLLQHTIEQLNTVVHKLNTESGQNLPPRAMIDTLVSNTQVLTELFGEPAENFSTTSAPTTRDDVPDELFFDEDEIDNGEPTEPAIVATFPSISQAKEKSPEQLQSQSSLGFSAIADKFSQWLIPSIIAVLVIVVVTVGVMVYRQSPTKMAETIPPSPSISSKPEVITTPSELESPGFPEAVELAPPPSPKLTPEQSLIVAIKTEIDDLTHQYPEGLIKTIEANFLGSRLIITLGDNWNQLSESRKQNLVNSIFQRSRRLDFRKLELIDEKGNLIARSPVVGEKVVIFSR